MQQLQQHPTKRNFTELAKWITQQLNAGNGIIDSGATEHFLQKGVGIPTGQWARKVVGMPNGQTKRASQQVLLPIEGPQEDARRGDELPSLQHNSLISVPNFLIMVILLFLGQAKKELKSTNLAKWTLWHQQNLSSEGGKTPVDSGVPHFLKSLPATRWPTMNVRLR